MAACCLKRLRILVRMEVGLRILTHTRRSRAAHTWRSNNDAHLAQQLWRTPGAAVAKQSRTVGAHLAQHSWRTARAPLRNHVWRIFGALRCARCAPKFPVHIARTPVFASS